MINTKDVKNIYIPYLQKGYSENSVQDLLSKMKINSKADYQKVNQKALEIFDEQNLDIRNRNSNRNFIVKVLDTLLWALSFGFLRLLEKETKTDKLILTANKIKTYMDSKNFPDQTPKEKPEKLKKDPLTTEGGKAGTQASNKKTENTVDQKSKFPPVPAEKKKVEEPNKKTLQPLKNNQSEPKVAYSNDKKKDKVKPSTNIECQKIKEVKALWTDNVNQELIRLNAKQLIPQQGVTAIASLCPYSPGKLDPLKIVVGRVMELKQLYSPTHYVFTHGQGMKWSVVNQCMHRLQKTFMSENYHPHSLPFRLPFSIADEKDPPQNVNDFFKKYPNIADNTFNDDALNQKTGELVSVDTYMWNTGGTESALYFSATGTNIANTGLDIFKSIFVNYFQNYSFIADAMAGKAAKIASDKEKASQIGNLWAICIPKEVVKDPLKNPAYRSHAYGRRCTCFPEDQDIKILEDTQKEVAVKCKTVGQPFPQYRLLTALLEKEPGVRTFPVNALSQKINKDFNSRIKNLIRECALYAKIIHLDQLPSGDEAILLEQELKDLILLKQIDKDSMEVLCMDGARGEYLTPGFKAIVAGL